MSVILASASPRRKELLAGPFFTEDLRKVLCVDKIEQFYSDAPDSLFQRMKRAKERGDLHVEQQFLIGLPARRLGQEIPLQEEDGEQVGDGHFATEEPVVLQGIIDGFFLEKDEEGKVKPVTDSDDKLIHFRCDNMSEHMPVRSHLPDPGSIWLSRRKTPIMPDFPRPMV